MNVWTPALADPGLRYRRVGFEPATAPGQVESPPGRTWRAWCRWCWNRRGAWVAPLAGLATAALMLWHLGTPALWLDESASAVSSARTWPHLWRLLDGTDAPLVPYYAVLKVLDGGARSLVPALAHHQALMLRWPSALAMVVAVVALTRWVRQVASTGVAAASAAILLGMAGVSRYGQEARPYALVLMVAVIGTVLWWRALRTGSRRTWIGYTLAVAALVLLHALAAGLILVHVLATPLMRIPADPDAAPDAAPGTGTDTDTARGPGRDERRRRTRTTIVFAGLAVALAAPLSGLAVRNGGGATRHAPDDLRGLVTTYAANLVGKGPYAIWVVAVLVLLGGAGLTRWSAPRQGDLVRLCTLWVVLPSVLWVGAGQVEANLLIGRYVLFVLPAIAVLAAVGLSAVAGTLARTPYLAAALMLVPLAALTALQWPALVAVRTSAGHDEDLRPSLAALDQAAYRHLPIYVSPGSDAIEIQALDRADDGRLLNVEPQADGRSIWPLPRSPAGIREALRRLPAVLLLDRQTCLTKGAWPAGYRLLAVLPHGHRWHAYLAGRGAGRRPRICA